jgi:hypothetical protein
MQAKDDPTIPSISLAHRIVESTLNDRDCVRPRDVNLARAYSQDVATQSLCAQVTFMIDGVSVFPMPFPAVDIEPEASFDEEVSTAHAWNVGLCLDAVSHSLDASTNDGFIA